MTWKIRLRRRRAVALAVSTCVLIVAAPTAAAQTVDLRSPDAREAAVAADQAPPPAVGSTDLRSPDARDAAVAAQQAAQPPAGPIDLRSPDTRDAARGVTTGTQPSVPASRTVISVEEGGSQTLAIVFSSVALLMAFLAVGFVAVSRRARPRWNAP